MIENYRSGFVWSVMRRNPYIRRGLERAGFTGGWLWKPANEHAQAALLPATTHAPVAIMRQ
jgi:hypothetical protein